MSDTEVFVGEERAADADAALPASGGISVVEGRGTYPPDQNTTRRWSPQNDVSRVGSGPHAGLTGARDTLLSL